MLVDLVNTLLICMRLGGLSLSAFDAILQQLQDLYNIKKTKKKLFN